MSNNITQDMKYRQSLMKYAEKYGVSRASRKYNKGRSYIYFWRSRWDSLLMAFAKLDENGSGTFFSREEYCQCLDHLWQEIDKHFGHEDVCIPILGSGRTRFSGGSGESLSQQELLDLMIYSYTLSSHKIKNPSKLRIICRKAEGFSLNNIMQ